MRIYGTCAVRKNTKATNITCRRLTQVEQEKIAISKGKFRKKVTTTNPAIRGNA